MVGIPQNLSGMPNLSGAGGISPLGGQNSLGGSNAAGIAALGGLPGLGSAAGLGSMGGTAGLNSQLASPGGGLNPLGGMGVSQGTQALMGQIYTMLATVLTGIGQMIRTFLAMLAQRQAGGGQPGSQTGGGMPSDPTSGGDSSGGTPSSGGKMPSTGGGKPSSGKGTPSSGGGSPTSGGRPPSNTTAGKNPSVDQAIDEAVAHLAAQGVPESKMNKDDIRKIIQKESGGNPRAINKWDSNAKKGTPSKGLMQTIDPTFQQHRDKTLANDPYDPKANIVAGIRYSIARYGSVSNVPGVVAMRKGGNYRGY